MILNLTAIRIQRLVGVLLVLLLLVIAADWVRVPLLQRLELASYDLRTRWSLSYDQDPSLVMVDLDERSLTRIGQWPWPRDVVAQLVFDLFERYRIQLLGIDVVFAEPEGRGLLGHWQQYLDAYPALAEVPAPVDGDALLAGVLGQYPVVLGYVFQALVDADDAPPIGALPPPQIIEPESRPLLERVPLPRPQRYTANLPLLQEQAWSGGFFDNPHVDMDGVFRRVPLLQHWQGEWYASLPLAMFQMLLGGAPVQPMVVGNGNSVLLEGLDVGGFRIPVDERGAALVPWYGPAGHFRRVSAVDVLTGEISEEALEGALVLLGTSAPGLMDLRSTPVGPVFPGAEIQLSLLAGMLHQSFLAEPGWVGGAELVTLLLLGLLLTWALPRFGAVVNLSLVLLLLTAAVALSLWAWTAGLVLPVVPTLLLIALQGGWHITGNFYREAGSRRWLHARFGQYIPPELVDEMMTTGQDPGLQGQVQDLTILFSDVRNFTRFAEGIPADALSVAMNRLLTPLTEAVHLNRGTIDKYMGDAIMAFWGAPLPEPDHARRALEGAVAMQEAMRRINERFEADGYPPMSIGVGLNSGPVSVGNMGSEFRMAYTVMGDNVNLASRLEGMTKQYGVGILVGEATAGQVPDWVFRSVDRIRVKGRTAPVRVYEPLGPGAQLTKDRLEQLALHEAAIHAYQQGLFDQAEQQFLALEQDALVEVYLDRIRTLKQSPPSDWDGVWTHTTK